MFYKYQDLKDRNRSSKEGSWSSRSGMRVVESTNWVNDRESAKL